MKDVWGETITNVEPQKVNKKKIILYVVGVAIVIYLLYTIYLLIKEPTNIVTDITNITVNATNIFKTPPHL